MQTFILKAGLKIKFDPKQTLTLQKDARFPVWGCTVSLGIREGKPSHDLFWRGYGHAKIKVKDITFEEIPDLGANFTRQDFKDYAAKYSPYCAQEFLRCCDYSKPSEAHRLINGTKNEEIWENNENQYWFKHTFGRELNNFIDGYAMGLANTYAIDIIKFEKYLACEFQYPMHKDISMNDFMVEKFGQETVDKFKKLFFP